MKYDELASKESIEKIIGALKKRGYEVDVVGSGQDALLEIKKLIPEGASVMNGSSVTLEQIGFIDYLKSKEHKWNNLHEAIVMETDEVTKMKLRKESLSSDYYLGSVHALVETGEFIVASNTGSQLPHLVFTSPNLILVVSTKKIVASLEEGMNRLKEYVVGLEDKHMQEKYGVGTRANKILIFNGENEMNKRKIRIILVEENLGF